MTTAQRTHAVAVMDYMHQHSAHLLYPHNDVRTSLDNECWHWSEQTLHHVLDGNGYWQGDCSEFCPFVLKCTGAWRWSTPGATSSHVTMFPVYEDAKAAYPGALVVFGSGGGHHEAIVHTADHQHGNPLLASHGRPGFDLVRLHDLAASQAAAGHPGARFLSVAHL